MVVLILLIILFIVFCILQQEAPSNDKKEYRDLLNDNEWKNKKKRILQRDEYECQYCHTKNKILHVHHKFYYKYPDGEMVKPWEYDDDALITLCEDCHKWYHSKHKPKIYYRKRMLWDNL